MLERGITIRKGRHYIEESLPAILEDPDNELSGALRVLLTQLRMGMQYLHGQIEETDKLIARICGELERVPAPAARSPESGRSQLRPQWQPSATVQLSRRAADFLPGSGVVPGEHSTGGKQKLTGTSRRGNNIYEKLFQVGACALLQKTKQSSGLSTWLVNLTSRRAQAGGNRGAGQQDGTHGLGGAV